MLKQIISTLAGQEEQMFALLEKMVLTQSGTRNKAGVDRVGQLVQDFFADLPLHCELVKEEQFGNHLVFTTAAADRNKEEGRQESILITGHMDTVFPEDTDFNWFRRDDDTVHGPGVIDMKGGLVVTMFAVQALGRAGLLAEIPLILLFNSDEELGSPSSNSLVEKLADQAGCALVTECGGMEGQVVTGRRGKKSFRIEVEGQAGHAAFAGKDKASAILELCRLVPELEKLNNPEQGLVLNVGVIAGGMGPNTVAKNATALVDTRFCTPVDGNGLQEQLEQLVAVTRTPGTRARVVFINQRPVLEQSAANQKLYAVIQQQAGQLGIPISEEVRQGVSDASNIAGQGVAVVDGLGPIGQHDHSSREYMLAASLLQRCQLLAATLFELNRTGFAGQGAGQ
jgi:glutamate carboxypeptidase